MSHLDPFGGHTPSDDWSSPTGGGRDERSRARHDGAAPDPYAEFRRDADAWSPGTEPQSDADPAGRADPAGTGRNGAGSNGFGRVEGSYGAGWGAFGADPGTVEATGAVAYPMVPVHGEPPQWEAPTAATSTSQAEFDAQRGPGRRRAGPSGSTAAVPEARTGRAGRNLGAAIAVGLSLGALIIASLFIYKPAFGGVIVVAVAVGIWEMVRALRHAGATPALIPLVAGGIVMIGLTAYAGTDGLLLALAVTVAAAMVWRIGDGAQGLRRDLTATVLVSVYVPFLLAFAMLLVKPDDGGLRVVATVIAVVLSDTGGYAAGVFLGRHKMAPTISPSKSWEGFGGSVLAAALGSALVLYLAIDVTPWQGAIFGAMISVVAVLGDLTESMMKRDLGIKDMSQLLPGHGGLMDRLDSILFAVPTAYLLLSLIAPSG